MLIFACAYNIYVYMFLTDCLVSGDVCTCREFYARVQREPKNEATKVDNRFLVLAIPF